MLLAGVPAVAAAAASPGAWLTVQGATAASTRFVIHEKISGSLIFPVRGSGSERRLHVASSGTYAGLLIRRATGSVAAGFVAPRGWTTNPSSVGSMDWGSPDFVLQPGTYDLTLLTDGASTIRVPISGKRNLLLHPRGRASVRASTVDLTHGMPTAFATGGAGFRVERSTTALSGMYMADLFNADQHSQVCSAAAGTDCRLAGSDPYSDGSNGLGGYGLRWQVYMPGTLRPGIYDTHWTDINAGAASQVSGFVIALE